MAEAIRQFPQCPHPEYIHDDIADIRVKNHDYEIWMGAFITGLKTGITTLSIIMKDSTRDPEVRETVENIIKLLAEKK